MKQPIYDENFTQLAQGKRPCKVSILGNFAKFQFGFESATPTVAPMAVKLAWRVAQSAHKMLPSGCRPASKWTI